MLPYFILTSLYKIISLERALDSYAKEDGAAPAWMTPEQQKAAIADRWYIDVTTATCKKFKYLGSLGNFNNFVSKEVCQYHLKFTPEEQSKACEELKSEGSCTVPEGDKVERWYFSKTAVEGSNAVNSCHKFKYTGCGGNANNFMSDIDCKNACQNKKNGKVNNSVNINTLTAVPNKFDCLFAAEVDNATPKMGIVLHKDKKRCVYAAVGQTAERGYFDDLPKCVETCISELVAACSAPGPYQAPLEQVTTTEDATVKEYYYFHNTDKVCLPFLSKGPTENTFNVDDGSKNIFSSAELCASFCPAINQIGDIQAVDACNQKIVGEWAEGDKYKFTRYHYDSSTKSCKSFIFNGKQMNLNNFKSDGSCTAICKTPLTTN